MPSRNVIREFTPGNYYHIYNRGVAKQPIFIDDVDKSKFMSLVERYLNPNNDDLRDDGVPYDKFDQDIELICYCLMGNHFHLLLYLKGKDDAVSSFIRSVCTAYTMYFNKHHKRVGGLFQGVFKSSRITNDAYLQHVTRYIHTNPRYYKRYKYSSLRYFLGEKSPVWLRPESVVNQFDGDYIDFVQDYEEQKEELDYLKHELADY